MWDVAAKTLAFVLPRGPGRALESPGERPGRKEPLRMKKNLKCGKKKIKGRKKH